MDQQWLQGLQCACVMGRAGRGVEEGSIIHGSAMATGTAVCMCDGQGRERGGGGVHHSWISNGYNVLYFLCIIIIMESI